MDGEPNVGRDIRSSAGHLAHQAGALGCWGRGRGGSRGSGSGGGICRRGPGLLACGSSGLAGSGGRPGWSSAGGSGLTSHFGWVVVVVWV